MKNFLQKILEFLKQISQTVSEFLTGIASAEEIKPAEEVKPKEET